MRGWSLLLVWLLLAAWAQAGSPQDEALFAAIEARQLDAVRKAITQGANPNAILPDKGTALTWAAFKADLPIMRYLVSQSASPLKYDVTFLHKANDQYYSTPIDAAGGEGKLDIVRYLVEECAVPVGMRGWNHKEQKLNGSNALENAAFFGHDHVIQYLLSKGADPNDVSNSEKCPALIYAIFTGQIQTAKLLLEKTNAQHKIINGYTALHYAVQVQSVELVRLLLAKGASVREAGNDGITPLMSAAFNGHIEIAALLIAKGADPKAVNAEGLTASQIAEKADQVSMANYLRNPAAADIEKLKKSAQANTQGLARYNEGDYRGAIRHFEQAVALDPAFGIGHLNIAKALRQLGDIDDALHAIGQAIAQMPNSGDAYNLQADLYAARKDYPAAKAAADKAIERNPSRSDYWHNRATAKMFMQRFEGALSDYDEAIRLDPNFAESYLYRAVIKKRLDDPQGACADVQKALALGMNEAAQYAKEMCDPKMAEAERLSSSAVAKRDNKNLQGAIADITRAIELVPNNGSYYFYRGLFRTDQHDWQGAIRDYDEAIRLDSKNARAWAYRGFVKIGTTDVAGGIADCDRAIALNPDSADAYGFRGIGYKNLGRKTEACKDLQKAVSLGDEMARSVLQEYCR